MSLQADGKVAFEYIPLFSVCPQACHDSSLCLFVLVLFHDLVVLSQVHVALDILYQHIFVFAMFIVRPIRVLSSDSSCNICCSSCGVYVHRNMSSAKRRLERNSPSIFTPLFSQFNLLNMLSNVAVNSLGEMVSLCLIPLLILIVLLSLCRCTVTELSVYMYFKMYMYTSSIPCSCNDVNIAWVCTESNAFS